MIFIFLCDETLFFYSNFHFLLSPHFFFFLFGTTMTKYSQKNGEQVYDKCQRYAVDWKIILQNTDIDSLMPNESWPMQSCDKGWEYNKTDVQSSIVIDVRKQSSNFPIFYFTIWAPFGSDVMQEFSHLFTFICYSFVISLSNGFTQIFLSNDIHFESSTPVM